jgi:hypothetical protein
MALEELLEKKPALAEAVYGKWLSNVRRYKVQSLYRAEFPQGKRIRNSQISVLAGVILNACGTAVLVVNHVF